MALRYPKDKIRVLLLENIHPRALEACEAEGYQVETTKRALTSDELQEELQGVHLLGIRSNTKVTAEVLAAAPKLLSVGAFCIGTNQIDLGAAAHQGVAVFNAPYSNTRSVVEMAISEIISLYRGLQDKSAQMHEGVWNKSAIGSHEIRGRNLGIVGYGNIGSQLSVLAENMGMNVYFYDVADKLQLGNARQCSSLEELLGVSDVVTLHVDARPSNQGFFGEEQFGLMRDGSFFLNLSRGFLVDDEALRENVLSGRIAGAAIDVFPTEPKSKDEPFTSPLRGLPNVILTPHIGGSTEEAQENIGSFVMGKLISFVNNGDTVLSVNLPELSLPAQAETHRFIHIHHNVPGVLARINNVFAAHEVNVVGQYLGTRGEVGYVTTDIESDSDRGIEDELRALPETIRVRVLY